MGQNETSGGVLIRTRWGAYHSPLPLDTIADLIRQGTLIPIEEDGKTFYLNPAVVATAAEEKS